MTLYCGDCGSGDLQITSQNYTDRTAYERYKCGNCGGTGSLKISEGSRPRTNTTGCVSK